MRKPPKAIRENPDDDTVRLVYADWLDEHDKPVHAQYLRELVHLVNTEQMDGEWLPAWNAPEFID